MFVIAGASGHVGSVVATALLEAGKKVRVLVRRAEKGEAWARRGAEVAVGELADLAFLRGAFGAAEGAFVLLPDRVSGDFHVEQRKLADAIASAVRESGVPHVVMLSSLGADLPSGTGVLVGLHHFERSLRETGAKLTAIRATALQENVSSSIPPARAAGIYANLYPTEDYPLSMVATNDVGALAARALLHPPAASEVVDIEGPRHTPREIADMLAKALGKEIKVVTIPPAAQVDALMRGGMPRTGAEGLTEMIAAIVAGRIVPRGDRHEHGLTPLEEVVRSLVPSASA